MSEGTRNNRSQQNSSVGDKHPSRVSAPKDLKTLLLFGPSRVVPLAAVVGELLILRLLRSNSKSSVNLQDLNHFRLSQPEVLFQWLQWLLLHESLPEPKDLTCASCVHLLLL
jgi:hypothetical protein